MFQSCRARCSACWASTLSQQQRQGRDRTQAYFSLLILPRLTPRRTQLFPTFLYSSCQGTLQEELNFSLLFFTPSTTTHWNKQHLAEWGKFAQLLTFCYTLLILLFYAYNSAQSKGSRFSQLCPTFLQRNKKYLFYLHLLFPLYFNHSS